MVIPLLLALATAVPASTPTIRDILEITDLSGLATSPDGHWVTFRAERPSIADNSYTLDWYLEATDGHSPPRRVADGGDALYNTAGVLLDEVPVWSPRSEAFYTRKLVGSEIAVWRTPIDGAPSEQITHDPANVRDLSLAPAGTALVYHVGASRAALASAEEKADDEGVRIDETVDISQPIVRGAWVDGHFASQRFIGGWFERGDLLANLPQRTLIIPLTATSAASKAPLAAYRTMIEHETGGWRLTASRDGNEDAVCALAECLARVPLSAVPLPDGKRLLVTTSEPGQSQTLSLWDPAHNAGRIVFRSKGLVSGNRDPDAPCAVTSLRAICVEATANQPPRLISIDFKNGRRIVLFEPNIKLQAMVTRPARRLDWSISSGVKFAGELFLPPATSRASAVPLVVTYYACQGYMRGGVGDELPILPLAQAGIATLCINKQRSFSMHRDVEVDYHQAKSAIETIVDKLIADGVVDRRHVGMWGLSFGSEIVTMMAIRSHLLSAASIATAQFEPAFYWSNSAPGRQTPELMKEAWQVGDPESDPAGWKRISPALNVDEIRTPLLMQVPEDEARTTMELLSKLGRTPVPVEMFAFARETHQKLFPRHKAAAYERNFDWFRFWLQGAIDPDPGKAEQYRRWTSMAERWRASSLDRLDP